MKILGLASWFHDSSAALLLDGELVSYAEEERFNREKHTNAYPMRATEWVLASNQLTLDDLNEVVFYVNPARYLWTGLKALAAHFPASLSLARRNAATMPVLERMWHIGRLKPFMCRSHNAKGRFDLIFLDHYRTHQGSAFYASGFDDAAILTMDFAVDGTTEVIAHGRDCTITDKAKHRLPHGFAIIYAAMTHVLGFKWYDEYKVMGMAAFGEPTYLKQVNQLYAHDPATGKLELNLDFFEFHKAGRSKLLSEKMNGLFGPPRDPAAPVTQREYDLAASLQAATNQYGLAMAALARKLTGSRNLCLAGGVAQNCLMNQAICESGLFENVFIQPLAGDVGGSMGGALYRYHAVHGRPRKYVMRHLYLGPDYVSSIPECAQKFRLQERPSADWRAEVGRAICDGLIVGYFDGRMEAGPRALGARSILADARRSDMKDILNSRVKHREHFRPFAPSILAEEVNAVFELLPACRSLDYMITTMSVRPEWKSRVPAITHNDGTARVQAVHRDHSPNFHSIISHYQALTGVPLVINTSFNDNEPIVCTPDDAIRCFMRTRIDLLVLGGHLYYRADNLAVVNG
ncbi:MAG TPA: carbamoyltransferase C-terminal domain-containing protein [Terriglobales bacterium]|nr:carbamoyltransferase C-terminal domain-containing protein [Terriglobales bacterium]